MSKDVRYNCTHGIEAGKEKYFEGRKFSTTGTPRVSLIAAEMFQPNIISQQYFMRYYYMKLLLTKRI